MKTGRTLYYFILPVIIIISFFIYSSRYYPLLNSDDALNILMTFYYKLPQDIYCWGQDRGGTLIPLISQVFHRIFGFSAVNSVSLSNYFILILGYIGISSLFKNNYTKLLFAVMWFFPAVRFIDLTRFPIGVQYSLIGFSIFLINRIHFKQGKSALNHVLMFLVVMILSVSIWVSDLAIVSIVLLLLVLSFFHYREEKGFRSEWPVILYTIAGVAGSYFFIRYAKGLATGITPNYTAFNSPGDLIQGLTILIKAFFSVYAFQSKGWVFSIYAWLALVGIMFLIFSKSFISVPKSKHRWLAFFILDFLAMFGVMLLSKWVFLNGMGRWYFVSTYISFSIVVLIVLDNLKLSDYKSSVAKYIIAVAILIGALSTPHFLKYVWPKTLRPRIDVKSEFLTLGEIGIIGNFWYSYISACPDPSKIKATAHDKSVVRNRQLVDEVFAQPQIYVIKDTWLESFPDTLEQFGRILVKEGDSFNIADCEVNRYVKVE